MHIIDSGKRKSGVPLVGDMPWGSHVGQFYQTKQDLLDILVPYFKAGLENNESCVWVTSGPLSTGEARRAMAEALPGFEEYIRKGQMEIIPRSRWSVADGTLETAIVARLDKVISGGYDGLRLTCSAFRGKRRKKGPISTDARIESGGEPPLSTVEDADAITKHNVIAIFTYPRDEFDAIELMEVVKNHRFALVRNAGNWEVIESSEATIARDALRRSEEKLRYLFSNMGEGFAYHRIVVDGRGKPCDYVFLEVNDAFERLTGLKQEDIIGRRVTEVLPGIEKDSMDWIGKYGRVALTGEPVQFESYAELLDRWYSVSAFSPHKGFFAATFGDITERKKAENELLKAKGEWERTFNSVPDLIAILDAQHRIIRANLALADRLGLAPEQCIGLRCHDVVHGMPDAPGFCPLTLTCQDGHQHVAEVHEPRLGGDFLISTTPLRDAEGQLTGAVHVARDITELKKAEKALRRRTQELEAANEEMESFSYTVSHDLRAPLRSMDGYSLALLEDYADKLDEEGRDWLRRIRDSSQMMGELIDDILGLSRVVRSELKAGRVDLSSIAASVAESLRKSEPARHVDFNISAGIEVWGDASLLRLAVENLLGNAFKYTCRRQTARIEFGAAERDGKKAWFVRDNGVGFDMKYVGKLFRPFQRLHSDKEFPGTGIGLVTVQRIMKRHGGQVWAEGDVGKGATFYFTVNQEST